MAAHTIDGTLNVLALALGAGIINPGRPTAEILVTATPAQPTLVPAGDYMDYLIVRLATGETFIEWTGVIRATAGPQ